MLEQLALGDARVAHQADVHVAAQPHAVRQAARDAADEREQQRLLDVAVAEDLRGERAGEPSRRHLPARWALPRRRHFSHNWRSTSIARSIGIANDIFDGVPA